MTAILDDIRRLDAAHARGEITAADLKAAKARLMDAVPEVRDVAPAPATPADKRARPGIGAALLLCALILTICVGGTLVLTGDIMLSATVSITVLAAFTVMLFRQLDG
ncbi:SHOCT domain-containing protein [uncultured Tateyamaria sp.]|uniref:SHOCT domain-containing protein n=1 Tax=Tateyamaria sp. TaxID=1929288 RepID=UPI0026269585|nr:SHOCT domain-containing protein [uncultured Tateyamaria sp.]